MDTETKRQVKDIIGNKRSQFLKLEERLKVAAHKACRDKHLWEPRRGPGTQALRQKISY